MADDLKIGLKITADGKQAVGEIGRVTDAIEDIGLAAPDLDQIIDAFKGVDAAAKDTAPDIEKVEDALTKAFKATGARSSAAIQAEINKIRNALSTMRASAKVTGQEYDRAFAAGTKKIQELEAEMSGLEKQTKKVEVSAGSLATGLKALAGGAVVKEFVSANASMESLGKSLEMVSGSSESAAKEMEFVRSEAARLGIEINSAARSYIQFAASANGTVLEGQQTREIWTSIAETMARLGKTAAETDGALLAVSQMISKGTVSAEELRGQLGERLPGAFNTAARAIGVSTQELGKMLVQGQVIAADFLPKFAAELNKLSGGGGTVETFNANIARMTTAMKDVAVAIGDTGLFDAITWSLAKLADATSYATLGFKIMAARIKGDDAGLEKLSAQARAVQDRLFGIGDATKKAAGDIANMGAQVAATSTQIEQDVRNKIAGSLIKLDSSIKDTAAAFKTLGIDPEEIKTGIGAAEREIINGFKRIAADPAINGQVLLGSLLVALDKVGKEAVPELGFAFKAAANAGRQSAEEMAAGVEILKNKLRETGVVTKTLEDAYKTLGITSQVALKAAADEARAAYEMIVKSGAPLADQAAAWTAHANSAIAANGGVASSLLQSQAAQHGLTIAIDETGKASIRTKDVLESMADAARRAADAAAGANTAAMESVAIAASQARTSIGTMADSIGGFRQHIQEMGGALSGVINSARQDMANLSDAALDMYMSMDFGNAGESIGMFLEDVARNTAYVTTLFNQQAETAEYWRQRLADGVDTAGDLTTATQVLGSQLTILGNEQLDPLRNAIADAERRMLDLRDAAQSTLDNIQDEWDQLNNNLDEIERRRAAKREAELQAQIAAAKASGDREAIADLAKALDLLKQVTAARIADAKQREKDAASNTTSTSKSSGSSGGITTGASGTPRSGGTTNIIINGTVTNSPAELARLLKPDLDRLQRLGG